MRQAVLKILLPSVILFLSVSGIWENVQAEIFAEKNVVEKKELDIPVSGGNPGSLYSLSAVLMDGLSGRILYEKGGDTPRANASTTKVLTCILALENGAGDDYVMVSSKAAAQPDVQLGLCLLYTSRIWLRPVVRIRKRRRKLLMQQQESWSSSWHKEK